jgi:general secretion pathway protein L
VAERPVEIDLNAPVHLSDVPAALGRVWRWWMGELQALLPRRLQRAVPRAPAAALLHVSEGAWRFSDGEGRLAGFTVDPGLADKDLARDMLAAAPGFSLKRLVVVLPEGQVLQRRVELPLAAERQLLAAVALQVDRLTPFKFETVRMAVRPVDRDAVDGTVSAACVFMPRNVGDSIEMRLEGLGLAVERFDIAGADGAPQGFSLVTPDVASQPAAAPWGKLGLVAMVVGAWWVAGLVRESAREQEVAAWQARVEALRPLAGRSVALRARLDGLAQPATLAASHRGDAVLSVLEALTAILPDTARLTEFDQEGGRVRIAGVAQEAAGLIPLLEASPRFRDARFLSQVMRVAETNTDRFEIGITLEEGKP